MIFLSNHDCFLRMFFRLNCCHFPSKYYSENRFQIRALVSVQQVLNMFDREFALAGAKQNFSSIL